MFSKGVTWRMLGACGRVSPNLARKEACEFKEGDETVRGRARGGINIPRFYHLEKSTNGIEPRDDVCATCPCVGDDDDWPGEREEFFEGLEVVSP